MPCSAWLVSLSREREEWVAVCEKEEERDKIVGFGSFSAVGQARSTV